MNEVQHQPFPDPQHDIDAKTIFGFWIFLLTDFVLFATLFAVYAVLRKALFGGTPPHELFNLEAKTLQTLIFLFSSFTAGIAGAFAHRREKIKSLTCFALTFLLGIWFMGMSFQEYSSLIASGNSWKASAFLSAYFTVVGTHMAHLIFGLLWIFVLCIPLFKENLNPTHIRRLICLRLFWQFLNVIWVFIYTFIYLMGEIR